MSAKIVPLHRSRKDSRGWCSVEAIGCKQARGMGRELGSVLPSPPLFLLTEKANRVKQDKNIRPYAISIDWLQLYCWNSGGFNPEYDTMTHHLPMSAMARRCSARFITWSTLMGA